MNPRLVALFLCASLLSVVQARAKTVLPDACGEDKVKFEVTTQKNQPVPAGPEAGKAQIIFVETVDKINTGQCISCGVVTRVGVDGAWVGGTKDKLYFVYSVDPGEHHLCVGWQSALAGLRQKVSMDNFTADPGNVYYYQIKVTLDMTYDDTSGLSLELVPLFADQGKYLVKLSNLASSSPKK
jgi:hypothetical protein